MKRSGLAILAGIALAGPLLAGDPRIEQRPYDPSEVVQLSGQPKIQAMIKFADDELIENVAIGDSTAWQVTPNKRADLLFVKPLADKARTNLTVVTSKRTYLFDLIANPRAKPLYVLSFSYPDAPQDEGERLAAAGANDVEMAAARDPYAVLDPAALNFEWTASGDKQLLPSRTFDNGEATFLDWGEDRAVPAILTRDAKGTEGPVNFAVRGKTIVIDGVPKEIILRSGKRVARLTNEGRLHLARSPRETPPSKPPAEKQ